MKAGPKAAVDPSPLPRRPRSVGAARVLAVDTPLPRLALASESFAQDLDVRALVGAVGADYGHGRKVTVAPTGTVRSMTAPAKPPQPKPCEQCGAMVQPVALVQLLSETTAEVRYTCNCGHEFSANWPGCCYRLRSIKHRTAHGPGTADGSLGCERCWPFPDLL